MTHALIPPPLREGGVVRIVSPSSPAMAMAPARRARAVDALTALGYGVELSAHCLAISDDGLSAGTKEQRASDLHDAFLDPHVDVVLAAAGGRTSAEVLDLLDADALRRHPKAFVGASDNAFVNAFLLRACGLMSYYGCSAMTHFGEAGGPFPETVERFRTVLGGVAPVPVGSGGRYAWHNRNWLDRTADAVPRARDVRLPPLTWLRGGRATGPFVGGESGVVVRFVTGLRTSLAGAVLFWDVADPAADLGRAVTALGGLPGFSALAGMVVGFQRGVAPEVSAQRLRHALDELVGQVTFPVALGGECGHYEPSWLIPFGAPALLDSTANRIVLRYSGERFGDEGD